MGQNNSLPAEFSDLEKYVSTWSLATEQERRAQRADSNIEDIRVFHDVMVSRGEAVLDYLNQFPLDGLSERQSKLFQLMLSLAEVTPVIEWYNQIEVVDGIKAERYEVDDATRNRFAKYQSQQAQS